MTTTTNATVHRHSTGPEGALVNAYLIETAEGIVAVDGTLTVSDGRALRAHADALGKPLVAVVVTHSHPDHYGGVIELVGSADVPIIATAGVDEVIRRDDEIKEQILRPMFGDEWPKMRTFPNQTVPDGETITFGGTELTVIDLGPGESPHDSVWLLGDDRRTAFIGDQIYGRMHAYVADGFHEAWLRNIDRLRGELPDDATLYIGHGDPVSPALFTWQRQYIETFLEAVRSVDWSGPEQAKQQVVERMRTFLPADDLLFLMELSIEPVAMSLGLATKP